MSTISIAPSERKLARYFRNMDPALAGGEWNIALRHTVRSDAARVFEALTRPEYLETWIWFPGDDEHSYVVAWRQEAGYRLDHYRHGKRDLIVEGSWSICRRRKMLFTWEIRGDTPTSRSLVYISLHGDFTNTILELHHRGIATASSWTWQQEMWTRSLERLNRLFRNSKA
jgi:uncharacterized protein YndB with AHSA1/START domain